MLNRLRQRSSDEGGFTLIELLVVILVIGILAAIAIPSFLSQKSKATDSSAKELVRTAETTMETYATDHGGSYAGANATILHEYEPTIQTAAGTNNSAYLSGVWEKAALGVGSGSPTATEYAVTVTSTSGHTFTIYKEANGETERQCTPQGQQGATAGGCVEGTW